MTKKCGILQMSEKISNFVVGNRGGRKRPNEETLNRKKTIRYRYEENSYFFNCYYGTDSM